jgi:hypothetical protein
LNEGIEHSESASLERWIAWLVLDDVCSSTNYQTLFLEAIRESEPGVILKALWAI